MRKSSSAGRRIAVITTAIVAANLILACADTTTSPNPNVSLKEGSSVRRELMLRTTNYENGQAVSQMKYAMRFMGSHINGRTQGSLKLLDVQTATALPRPAVVDTTTEPSSSTSASPSRAAAAPPGEGLLIRKAEVQRIGTDAFVARIPQRATPASSGAGSEPIVVEADFANLTSDPAQLASLNASNTIMSAELPVYLSATEVSNMLTTQATVGSISTVDYDSVSFFPLAPGNPSSNTYFFKHGSAVVAVYTNYVPEAGGWALDNMMVVQYDTLGVLISTTVFMVVNDELVLAAKDRVLNQAHTFALRGGMLAAKVLTPRDAIAQVDCNHYLAHMGWAAAAMIGSMVFNNPFGVVLGMGKLVYETVQFASCKEAERRAGGGHLPPCNCEKPY